MDSARSRLLRWFAALGPRRRGSDHGAVATIVAVLLSGGVLFGMGAVVIDVGQLYVEREQLQTGADSASWKIAINCVANSANCTSAIQTPVAVTYASKNAKDGKAGAQICLNGTSCPSWNTAITCPPLPTPPAGQTTGSYVEVRTTTLTTSGSTLLPPTFAGAISGTNYQGKKVGTCARVNWGPPVVAKVLALGISLCDWKRMTTGGTVFYGPLGSLLDQTGLFNLIGLPTAVPGADSAIPASTGLSVAALPLPFCTTPVDTSQPRGYAWLNNPDGSLPDSNCMISPRIGDYLTSFLLSNAILGTYCTPIITKLRNAGAPVLVPIFDQIKPQVVTLAPSYRIVGFAPFVFTGASGPVAGVLGTVGSLLSGSLLNAVSNLLCGLSSCIYGYFTKTLVPQARPQFGQPNSFGATVIGRTG
jgi:Flp pilus assembly protein TadG